MSESNEDKPLYVLLSTARHTKLKAYAALTNRSMRDVLESLIDELKLDS